MASTKMWAPMVVVLMASPASAGPDVTANRFLNDSPSMIDWGLYRITRQIERNSTYGADMGATYDWDANTIIIYNSAVKYETQTPELFEDDCREWFDWVRTNGYVSSTTGVVMLEAGLSRYADLFGHSGFRRTIGGIDEADALKALDQLITLEYRRWTLDASFKTEQTRSCTGKLLSTGFSVSRE